MYYANSGIPLIRAYFYLSAPYKTTINGWSKNIALIRDIDILFREGGWLKKTNKNNSNELCDAILTNNRIKIKMLRNWRDFCLQKN